MVKKPREECIWSESIHATIERPTFHRNTSSQEGGDVMMMMCCNDLYGSGRKGHDLLLVDILL